MIRLGFRPALSRTDNRIARSRRRPSRFPTRCRLSGLIRNFRAVIPQIWGGVTEFVWSFVAAINYGLPSGEPTSSLARFLTALDLIDVVINGKAADVQGLGDHVYSIFEQEHSI
jgi:hypothetical protein